MTAQLHLEILHTSPRWRFAETVHRSRRLSWILGRLERARQHFPELDDRTIRVGLVRKRGILGRGSLDPAEPAIWVRPRRLELFTIAHELVHLLQGRGLVPQGERACDLHALARSPELVDGAPTYLELPSTFRSGRWTRWMAEVLCLEARKALIARAAGDRRYLEGFERSVAAVEASRIPGDDRGAPSSRSPRPASFRQPIHARAAARVRRVRNPPARQQLPIDWGP